MTQKFRFYGSSDDNFCYDKMDAQGHWSSGDEIGVYNQSGVWVIEDFGVWVTADFGEQGLQVIGTYGGTDGSNLEDGVWSVGISQLDEEELIPDWPLKFVLGDSAYTVILEIQVPDSTKVTPVVEKHPDSDDGNATSCW